MHVKAKTAHHRAFQQGDKESAFAYIVRRLYQPGFIQPGNGCLQLVLFFQVEVRRRAVLYADELVQVFRTVNIITAAAHDVYQVAELL